MSARIGSLVVTALVSVCSQAAAVPGGVPWGPIGRAVDAPKTVPVQARVYLADQPQETAPVVAIGQPVRLVYEVKNTGTEGDVALWHSGFWPNHNVAVTTPRGEMAALRPKGVEAARAYSPRGARNKNVEWVLKPGQVDATEGQVDLAEIYDLSKAGAYRLVIFYEEEIAFLTNVLDLWVVPPRAANILVQINAPDLRLDRGLRASLDKALRAVGLAGWWDPVEHRHRVAEAVAASTPPVGLVSPEDQRCRTDGECVRAHLKCCCPEFEGAVRRHRARAVEERRAQACFATSCPEVVCRGPEPGLVAACSEGWCVAVGTDPQR